MSKVVERSAESSAISQGCDNCNRAREKLNGTDLEPSFENRTREKLNETDLKPSLENRTLEKLTGTDLKNSLEVRLEVEDESKNIDATAAVVTYVVGSFSALVVCFLCMRRLTRTSDAAVTHAHAKCRAGGILKNTHTDKKKVSKTKRKAKGMKKRLTQSPAEYNAVVVTIKKKKGGTTNNYIDSTMDLRALLMAMAIAVPATRCAFIHG